MPSSPFLFGPGQVVLTKIVEDEGPTLDYKKPEDFLYGLRTLINNVVLLRDDNRPNDDFYPRIEMWKCTSFKVWPLSNKPSFSCSNGDFYLLLQCGRALRFRFGLFVIGLGCS